MSIPTTIKHPTLGSVDEVQWTVNTNAGQVAATHGRWGWHFYLLPEQELIGIIFRASGCGGPVTQLHAMPWSRNLPGDTRLTPSTVTALATEVGNKHAELRASGEWAQHTSHLVAGGAA